MSQGPGKYDSFCTYVRKETSAEAVLLMVLNGRHGSGFAVQVPTGDHAKAIVKSLRDTAYQIENDSKSIPFPANQTIMKYPIQTIWKYPLEPVPYQTMRMPHGAVIIATQNQNDRICLWALVNPENPVTERAFNVIATGATMTEEHVLAFHGTVQIKNEVLHVFEIPVSVATAATTPRREDFPGEVEKDA